jgi:hypothetical protein
MSWQEVRGRRYYYRHRRVGGRPCRIYVGTGPAAELAAAADALRRVQGEIEARERREEQARLREAEEPLLALCELTEDLARAALVAAGYHRHDRGEWRRRHDATSSG